MDDILTKVQKYLNVKTINVEGINLESAKSVLPEGWFMWYEVFHKEISKYNALVISIEIKKGTLFVKTNKTYYAPIKWMENGLAKESTKWCMFTPGAKGKRRKLVRGWPCLSTYLWIEYANAISEEEWEIK